MNHHYIKHTAGLLNIPNVDRRIKKGKRYWGIQRTRTRAAAAAALMLF